MVKNKQIIKSPDDFVNIYQSCLLLQNKESLASKIIPQLAAGSEIKTRQDQTRDNY